MILVITRTHDMHGSHIIDLLRRAGEEVAIFDYGKFLNQTSLSFRWDEAVKGALFRDTTGKIIDSRQVNSVYNRRRNSLRLRHKAPGVTVRNYILREAEQMLEALPSLFPCFWLSDPDRIREANRKSEQIRLASELGFSVPRTLITNSSTEAQSFLEGLNSHVAVKSLSAPSLLVRDKGKRSGVSFFTRKIGIEEALIGISSVDNCPMIFQEYVDKSFELRITVVGDDVFPCAIYSQNSEKTREDYRRYDFKNTPYSRYELPDDIKLRCIEITKKFGLKFGCIDVAVTPEGEYVFFEINPNGQWLGIEMITGLPIASSITRLLTNPPSKN